jgi:hypothetical protein
MAQNARDWFYGPGTTLSDYDRAIARIELEMAKVAELRAAEEAARRAALKDAFRRSVSA